MGYSKKVIDKVCEKWCEDNIHKPFRTQAVTKVLQSITDDSPLKPYEIKKGDLKIKL